MVPLETKYAKEHLIIPEVAYTLQAAHHIEKIMPE
jgi:hypothetical protein